MGVCPAELLEGHVLACHGLDHVGAGDEHVAGALDHQGEVGDRGGVDGPARGRPHDQADLRDHAGGAGVAEEDLREQPERDHALLDAGAAAVVDADDRAAGLHRVVHDLDDLLAVDLAEGPAEHGEVLAEHATGRPSTVPVPVTTPSPYGRFASIPKSCARCLASSSNSTNEPSSSSRSIRSRAVSLPRACCFSTAARNRHGPPRTCGARDRRSSPLWYAGPASSGVVSAAVMGERVTWRRMVGAIHLAVTLVLVSMAASVDRNGTPPSCRS